MGNSKDWEQDRKEQKLQNDGQDNLSNYKDHLNIYDNVAEGNMCRKPVGGL